MADPVTASVHPDPAEPAEPDGVGPDAPASALPSRRLLVAEVVIVLLASLGRSAIYSVVNLLEAATAPGGLADQSTSLHGNYTPDRPWFDLTYQLLALFFAVVPVALAGYLLVRSGMSLRRVWLHRAGVVDLGLGAALAAVIGSAGLAFYLVMHSLGLSLTVVPDGLGGGVWWKVPVLVLSALQNAVLEEFVVLGYVMVRLKQLGFGDAAAIGLSSLLRGSYHLYQGLGGFVGNLVMGLLFGWLYRRWGRVTPLVVTHTLLDVGAFVGYAVLAGHVGWLPT